jgi:hypothetical protein
MPVVFHNGPEGKVIETLGEGEDIADLLQESFDLDQVFALSDLEAAFDAAQDVPADIYDPVVANCGTFILDMGKELNIPVSEASLEYTLEHLVDSGVVADMVRNSPHVCDLALTDDETADDETLLEAVLLYNV